MALQEQVSPELESRLSQLLSSINAIKSQISYHMTGRQFEQVQILEDRRDSIKNSYNRLLDSLSASGPLFSGLKHLNESVPPAQLAVCMRPEEVFLEFFMGQHFLYVFLIRAKQVKLLRLGNSTAITHLIRELYQYRHSSKEKFAENSLELYRQIFLPLEKHLLPKQHLIIVADGILGSVAFEALHRSPLDEWDRNYQTLDYLLHHHSFSFHHSARYFTTNANP